MKLNAARRPAVIAVAAISVFGLGLTGSAVADALITSSDIKNNTIRGKDIHDGTIRAADIRTGAVNTDEVQNGSLALQDLSAGAINGIQNGVFAGEHWGQILRNTQADGSATLRSGPYSGTTVAPPVGTGSLQLQTGDGARDKVAFGNEVDFVGKALSSVNAIGFAVFQTGEDTKADHNGGSVNADNLPNISLEVNPAVAGKTYSSLVFVPKGSAANVNKWRTYDAAAANTADGGWYFSNGDVGTATGCNTVTYCTWAQVKAAAPNASLLSVQVAKGADHEFQGAVDALRIGNTVYDFETRGVFARNA